MRKPKFGWFRTASGTAGEVAGCALGCFAGLLYSKIFLDILAA